MEENKPTTGAWEELVKTVKEPTREQRPRVLWEKAGEQHLLLFDDEPLERKNREGGVFWVIPVKESGEEKEIVTSAWTLLRGLAMFSPLKEKVLLITKKLKDGKQSYEVLDPGLGEVKE